MTSHWKPVEQCFAVVLFVSQFYPACNFGKFLNFGLGTVRSEWANQVNLSHRKEIQKETLSNIITSSEWISESVLQWLQV